MVDEIININPHQSYYVNDFFVITKNGLKAGIYGGIFATIFLLIFFYFMGRFTANVLLEANLTDKPQLLKSATDINSMTNPSIGFIIVLGLCVMFLGIMMMSRMDIVNRMERLWRFYNPNSWDELTTILRGKGYTYPWWKNRGFWDDGELVR